MYRENDNSDTFAKTDSDIKLRTQLDPNFNLAGCYQ